MEQRRDEVLCQAELPAPQRAVLTSLKTHWAGLTVSVPVSGDLGVGGTLYGVYRGQRSRFELSADIKRLPLSTLQF